MQLRLSTLVCLGLFTCLLALPARSEGMAATAEAIRALVASETTDPNDPATADLRRFYDARNDEPAWSNPAQAASLVSILGRAADHGLEASFPKSFVSNAIGDSSVRDVMLTRWALAFAKALAAGRIDPGRIEADWDIAAPSFDAPAGLATALKHDLTAWFDSLAPHHLAYLRLMEGLARYRKIAASGGWTTIPRGDPMKLGVVSDQVRALRRRLEAEGDLHPLPPVPADPAVVTDTSAPAPDPDAVFDVAVDAAVRRFQRRYGIVVDGSVGPRTFAAMNVPARERIEQIELNLERWRSLPHDLGTSYMLVNVPAETLDIVNDAVPVLRMKVIVGDVDHPTPVVRPFMVAVTFNPTWTIPASIVTKEIVPKSKRDHSYLLKNDIVFTPGRGWQQMAGPKNPLGQIKFETPNRFDVYLHDTPSHAAFDRFFRAQSHGCVRLERAPELASFVMHDMGWDEAQISQVASSGEGRRVDLKHRWRVYLLYATSFVDEDGTMEFRDDLYGRDTRLRDALAALRPAQKQAGL